MISMTSTTFPESFIPGENHIIIGRGRLVKNHVANKKFDKLVARIAHEYSAAPCKAEKGAILTSLVNIIHNAGPGAGFVRKDPVTGQWCLVEGALARQTAAQAIRNFLHLEYRSSKQFKSKHRMERIKEMSQQKTSSSRSLMTSLVDMMSVARSVSPTESLADESYDTVDLLMEAFAPSINPEDDPFEPRPIAPAIEDFLPFPFFS